MRKKTAKYLFIDPQRAFVGDGWWARHCPPGDTEPIAQACRAIDAILRERILPIMDPHSPPPISEEEMHRWNPFPPPGLLKPVQGATPPRIPFVCTRCYVDEEDGLWAVPSLPDAATPWLFKPSTDCSRSPGMGEFLSDCSCLYIGGCTTTSCVRVSSTAIRRLFPDVGRVVVVLSLCGARRENYERNAETHPMLVHRYGAAFCRGKSAVDLAVWQMRQCGVEVIDVPEDH